MNERSIIKAERKAKAINLLGDECIRCGSMENLQFDHINNDRRREERYRLISYLFECGWEKLLREVKKCQLLCRVCHSKKTRKDYGFQGFEHGTLSMYQNKKCRCEDCFITHADYMRKYWLRRRLA